MGNPWGQAFDADSIVVVESAVNPVAMDDPAFALDGGELCTILSYGWRWPPGEYRIWLTDAQGASVPEVGSCFSGRDGDDKWRVQPNESRQLLTFCLPPAKEGVYGLRIQRVGGGIKTILAPAKLRLVRPVRYLHSLELLRFQGRARERLAVGQRLNTEG